MAEIYLAPADINAIDTAKVLAFLNSVQTAQQIASRVEIPDELDIGIKLGQRIINARAELGGAYFSLAQLMAVPLIGPERFTEIVTEITGKSALDVLVEGVSPGIGGSGAAQLLALTTQFEQLQKQLDTAEELAPGRYRIEMRLIDENPFLGQIVTLKLTVVDRYRRLTKTNMPLTIETSQGNLHYARGYKVSKGAVVKARTGLDGQVIVKLHTPTIEPLTIDQQNALSNVLAKINHTARVPEDAREDFTQLTDLYQHPLNRDLRSAVDIHYKSRQAGLVDTLNISAATHSWDNEQILVRVYLHPNEAASEEGEIIGGYGDAATVLTIAALPIEYRDWLTPWYQYYKASLVASGGLAGALGRSLSFSDDEAGLSGHMIAEIQTFVSSQNGLVGERAGQQASNEVVTRLLTDDLTNLSQNTRATLYTLVNQAAGSTQASGKGNLAIANVVAVDVGRRAGDPGLNTELNTELLGRVGQLSADLSSHETRISSVETVTAGVDFSELSSELLSFRTSFDVFSQDYTMFETNYTRFDTKYTDFDTDFSAFNRDYLDFNNRRVETRLVLDSFAVDYKHFNVAAEQLIVNVTEGVNDALVSLQADNQRVIIKPVELPVTRTGSDIIDPAGGGR
ncbi:MAG: hypothetical protein KUG79_13920 [Pseudomonadales bacterium]|nr:hypothetical protein [Pseudomonadales bacterium]